MERESRVKKSLLNAKINLLFYFCTLTMSFFSRNIYLTYLTSEFVGFTSTLQNLLGFLNLAELGIGSAIAVVLYKPLYDNDRIKINEIISVFGYLYRIIGFVIIICGLILSIFLPFIFRDTSIDYIVIYLAFYSFLTSSLLGYFINYKQTLVGADQKNYYITAYFQTSNLLKSLIQMCAAYYTKSWVLWIIIELLFSVIYSIILNWRIRQLYPWLNTEIRKGKKLLKDYPKVMTYTRQLFIHRIASFVQFQTTPFILYLFSSLSMVACYTNYTLIANQLFNFANKFLSSTEAGVGNLVAENKIDKTFRIYNELTSLRYFIAGIELFCIYMLIEPFIGIWVGRQYLMNKEVLMLVLANVFILQTRGTNDQFLQAYGLFKDVWAPIAEAILGLSASLILGHYYGIEGVLSGGIISSILIVNLWKPYFLFHYGIHKSAFTYWFIILKNLWAILLSFGLSHILSKKFIQYDCSNFIEWGCSAIATFLIYFLVSGASFYLFTPGAKYLYNRFLRKSI